jgi:hypothetical protein
MMSNMSEPNTGVILLPQPPRKHVAGKLRPDRQERDIIFYHTSSRRYMGAGRRDDDLGAHHLGTVILEQ